MILGIAGTLGSGKGTAVKYLVEKKGFSHYSSSGLLNEILEERGITPTRANLSSLADELDGEYEGGVLHLSNERAKKEGNQNYILESIHRESEAAYIRSVGGYILGVDADVRIRYARAIKRQEGEKDNVSFEQFLRDGEREEEGKDGGKPHIRAVLEGADAVVMNDGTPEELYIQIDEALAQMTKSTTN